MACCFRNYLLARLPVRTNMTQSSTYMCEVSRWAALHAAQSAVTHAGARVMSTWGTILWEFADNFFGILPQ